MNTLLLYFTLIWYFVTHWSLQTFISYTQYYYSYYSTILLFLYAILLFVLDDQAETADRYIFINITKIILYRRIITIIFTLSSNFKFLKSWDWILKHWNLDDSNNPILLYITSHSRQREIVFATRCEIYIEKGFQREPFGARNIYRGNAKRHTVQIRSPVRTMFEKLRYPYTGHGGGPRVRKQPPQTTFHDGER